MRRYEGETARWFNHSFAVIPWWDDTVWRWLMRVPAVYIMSCYTIRRTWGAIYVGKSDDLRRRLKKHERAPEARRYAFSHLHVHRVNDAIDRAVLEELLIEEYRPHLNVQHRPARGILGPKFGPPIGPASLDDVPTWLQNFWCNSE